MPTHRRTVFALAAAAVLGGVGGALITSTTPTAHAQPAATAPDAAEPTTLAIVWTSGDPDVAHRMTLMYTHAAQRNGWFAHTRLVVWGPSARLLAGDRDLQAKVQQMAEDGVRVQACVACADSYGVSDTLRDLGIEVLPMGVPLTQMAKDPDVAMMTY